MKSLAKALLIITCLILACWMVLSGHNEFGVVLFLFAGAIAVLYDTN